MKLRISVSAFLKNGDNYLLIKRSAKKEIAPNLWSCIGGHMHPGEINNPIETCYREIEEETGIHRNDIFNLKLKYIMMRLAKDTIRQSFIYWGETDCHKLGETDEGTLHWVHGSELLNKEYSQTFFEMMKHYCSVNSNDEKIYVGIAENSNGRLNMNWGLLEDWE